VMTPASAAAVSHSCACIWSPCLRHGVHGASIGAADVAALHAAVMQGVTLSQQSSMHLSAKLASVQGTLQKVNSDLARLESSGSGGGGGGGRKPNE
jgi:hypothetical protein